MEKNKVNIIPSLILLCVVLAFGIIYKLNPLLEGLLAVFAILCLPLIYKASVQIKIEKKRFDEVCSYLTQMCASFGKTGKILESLKDTEIILSPGEMKEAVKKAISYIENGITQSEDASIWEEAFKHIENKFKSSRIKEIHRFFINVELEGSGDYMNSLNILLKDINDWIDRTIIYQKRKSEIKVFYGIGVLLSLGICTLSLFFANYVNISANSLYGLITTLFLLMCIFSYLLVMFMNKSSYLDEALNEKKLLNNYDFVIDCIEKGKVRTPKFKSLFKKVTKYLKLSFPEWIRTVAVNRQHETLQISIVNSYYRAPEILKRPIYKMLGEIDCDSTGIAPYNNFLKEFDIPEISGAMKLLYALTEQGEEADSKTLETLMERNYKLLDDAENAANDSKISALKQIVAVPLYFATLKSIVDLSLFVVMFLGGIKI